jgi:hypothetical protein
LGPKLWSWLAGLVCLTGLLLAGWGVRTAFDDRPERATPPTTDPILERIVNYPPMARPRDFFRVIDRPEYLPVGQADAFMSDDEIVLGLELAPAVRAYPINYLNDHELVRDEVEGIPILVSW